MDGNGSNPEAMDALSEMYNLLKEEDMWAGLWQKKAEYQETNIAIAYEQQGYFEQAQGAYELAMSKYRNDYNNGASPTTLQVSVFDTPYLILNTLILYNQYFDTLFLYSKKSNCGKIIG